MKLRVQTGHWEGGFTLTEVVVSIGLLSLALIGVAGLFLTAISAGALGEGAGVAFSLARACSEYLQSQGFTYVTGFLSLSDPCAGVPGLANPVVVPTLGRTYQLSASRTITGNRIDLIVTASWSETLGRPTVARVHNRTVATRLTANAP